MTTCWIITEQGLRGTENQCLALASGLGLTPEVKPVKMRVPWEWVTPWFVHFTPNMLFPRYRAQFKAPWPDLIIASGRKAIAPALWVKRQTKGKAILVIVQSPVIKNKNFDLVIAPKHDRYNGNNLLEITGALSVVTTQKLAEAKEEWAHALSALPSPRVAVLLGGNSRTHKITSTILHDLIGNLQHLQAQKCSLMITASRRTPLSMQRKLIYEMSSRHVHYWNGRGPNPYLGYLAWADMVVVTEDSVSMISEALTTGKPVYTIKMAGGSPRFTRFHDHLIQQGYARPFSGMVDTWPYKPPHDLEHAVKAVEELLK